jgi:hypothetical protein
MRIPMTGVFLYRSLKQVVVNHPGSWPIAAVGAVSDDNVDAGQVPAGPVTRAPQADWDQPFGVVITANVEPLLAMRALRSVVIVSIGA